MSSNAISPKKLLNSKWTSVQPENKEKHFLITEVEYDEEGVVIYCLMEAVLTQRSFPISWRVLKDHNQWLTGWR
ncbi:MAG: TIGR02450 family Trp-rich protein [Gammaproteobacteria bacterium]|jgi:tryptophan-rich hypothetical protein|nr:TIGR02450 family Trp-rich protein [Gammaproteobacteria bacterium]